MKKLELMQLIESKGRQGYPRCAAAQPTFAQGLVYAPGRDWSQMVIDEMELFPKGRFDDFDRLNHDGRWFPANQRHPQTDAEAMAAESDTDRHRLQRRLKSLYRLHNARRCFCRKRVVE